MTKVGSIDRVQPVYADDGAVEFAKSYIKIARGNHPRLGDEFHARYDVTVERHGFGGSGSTLYEDRETGTTYRIERIANGRTFWGTDHSVTVAS